jgi:hypothetical protein
MVNGKVENINVTTGLSGEDKVEIISGLADGDQIVLPQTKVLPQASGNMRGPLGR